MQRRARTEKKEDKLQVVTDMTLIKELKDIAVRIEESIARAEALVKEARKLKEDITHGPKTLRP